MKKGCRENPGLQTARQSNLPVSWDQRALLIANEVTEDVIGRCSHGDGRSPAGAAEESLQLENKSFRRFSGVFFKVQSMS